MIKYLVLAILIVQVSGCSYYNFGINRNHYPELFEGHTLRYDYNKDYSFHTYVPYGQYKALIHHGSVIDGRKKTRYGESLEGIGPNSQDYLWYSIKFYDHPGIRVSTKILYNGKEMEAVGEYIKILSSIRYSNERYAPYTGYLLGRGQSYKLVKLLELPSQNNKGFVSSKSKRFEGTLIEEVVIETEAGEVYELKHKSKWKKSGNLWSIITGL